MTIAPLLPNPADPRVSRAVEGIDENGQSKSISVIEERPLTIYLNSQEIVTAMTIGDHPEYLALGFLLNQGMLKNSDQVTGIDFDEELEVVVVRTAGVTDVEDKLEKKTRTSGCAVGTVFGDMMAGLEGLSLPDTPVHTSTFYDLSFQINHTPSLYMETGAIHGTALCQGREVLAYMEDVGRHNAVDKIAGWMHLNNVPAADKSSTPPAA
ncbi:MAG: FdhD protein [Marinobacter excellens HL-55]|uniref:FdhD protein n=1 Tax=Marinobacter excellens HL-55 TaxID=1305731 RepID=A0A0P8BEK7_9GAMM|nr:MAG: FdhD protein [Marinobacter excellens HL-55]